MKDELQSLLRAYSAEAGDTSDGVRELLDELDRAGYRSRQGHPLTDIKLRRIVERFNKVTKPSENVQCT